MVNARTVLIAMDFQHGIVGRLPQEVAERAIPAAASAVDAARGAGIPVVFVRVAFRPGYPEVSAANPMFSGIAQRGDAMIETEGATAIVDALGRRDDEPLVTKRRVSAFAGSDLDVLLRAHGAEHLVLAGISTGGVVLSTVRQAADLDFSLTVLADACGDADDEVHRVLIEKVFPRQTTVTTAEEWASEVGTPS